MDQLSVFVESQALLPDIYKDELRELGNGRYAFGKELRAYGKIERDIDEFDVRAQSICAVNHRHRFKLRDHVYRRHRHRPDRNRQPVGGRPRQR